MDLKIMNKGKDYLIDQLKAERQSFAEERKEFVEQLLESNHKIGRLETELRQLTAPKTDHIIDAETASNTAHPTEPAGL